MNAEHAYLIKECLIKWTSIECVAAMYKKHPELKKWIDKATYEELRERYEYPEEGFAKLLSANFSIRTYYGDVMKHKLPSLSEHLRIMCEIQKRNEKGLEL